MITRARIWAVTAGLALGMALGTTALAIEPGEMLKDQKLEQRARGVDRELRCLVCQNENIDDSNADLAHDLRLLVRQRIMAGDTDEQVKQYIVARYGNYVLLKPPFDAETYLLWFGPALLFVFGAGIAVYFYRRSPAVPADAPLSADEARRVAELLADNKDT